mmetsp:Transcript_20188/g.60308  ORF Transcript_20188/g.60308 Transcript_20188/m.60308 type:complete len:99 (-) Transcript_20188:198-494(-)
MHAERTQRLERLGLSVSALGASVPRTQRGLGGPDRQAAGDAPRAGGWRGATTARRSVLHQLAKALWRRTTHPRPKQRERSEKLCAYDLRRARASGGII